jgi:hypothetical protein
MDVWKKTPAELVSALGEAVRKGFGDKVQNGSKVYATHGYYVVELPEEAVGSGQRRRWSLRRSQVADFVKALKKGKGAFGAHARGR